MRGAWVRFWVSAVRKAVERTVIAGLAMKVKWVRLAKRPEQRGEATDTWRLTPQSEKMDDGR